MQNRQPFMGGFPEYNERAIQGAEIAASTVGAPEEQMLLDYLIDIGFVWEAAAKLLNLREHLYENPEMRQRMAEDHRMLFARWLYEQGEITEV
jgi:hypothetical protein